MSFIFFPLFFMFDISHIAFQPSMENFVNQMVALRPAGLVASA